MVIITPPHQIQILKILLRYLNFSWNINYFLSFHAIFYSHLLLFFPVKAHFQFHTTSNIVFQTLFFISSLKSKL